MCGELYQIDFVESHCFIFAVWCGQLWNSRTAVGESTRVLIQVFWKSRFNLDLQRFLWSWSSVYNWFHFFLCLKWCRKERGPPSRGEDLNSTARSLGIAIPILDLRGIATAPGSFLVFAGFLYPWTFFSRLKPSKFSNLRISKFHPSSQSWFPQRFRNFGAAENVVKK